MINWYDSGSSSGSGGGGGDHPLSYRYALRKVYDLRLTSLINKCHHIKSLQDLISDSNINSNNDILCIWINLDPEPPGEYHYYYYKYYLY